MNNQKITKYIKNRNDSLSSQKIGNLNLVIKDDIDENINHKKVFYDVNELIPDSFLNLIDVVYIGQFDFLNEREVNAVYMDGALYITNVQDSEQDLLDDVVHEISHAVEEYYGNEVYSDGEIEQNFINKRLKLERILKYHGYNVEKYDFSNPKYDHDFDEFLYKEVGYERLNTLTIGLLLAPYSITSKREYFARGFEEYYLGDRLYLHKVSPYIYNSLLFLEENPELDYEIRY